MFETTIVKLKNKDMSTKSEKKAEAKQVVIPKESNPEKPVVVATANDLEVNNPKDDKKISGEKAVSPTEPLPLQEKLKSVQELQHEKDFKEITESGIKEIIVDKERLQVVPHELTGKPVFETAEEYQKYLADK